jgi:DNA-binding HxlR family transcriptional regulator
MVVSMTEKMTNSKALAFVLGMEGIPSDVREKLVNIKASIDKKNSAERKPTATQTENVGLKSAILVGMASGKAYTIGDLMKEIPALADLTNQRVSALVRQLKDEGLVTREEVKRKAYFTKVEVETETEVEVDTETEVE